MSRVLYLMRHGATPVETPRLFLGRTDAPLSDLGRAQALRWRDALASFPLDAAWCSPLARARETALLALSGRGMVRARSTDGTEAATRPQDAEHPKLALDAKHPALALDAKHPALARQAEHPALNGQTRTAPSAGPAEALILPELAEIDLGAWEGLSVEEVRRQFPGQYEARGRDLAGFRPPGGESFQDVARRAARALDAMARAAGPGPWRILAVAHAGFNRALLCSLLGIPLERLFCLGQDHACLSVLSLDGERPALQALNLPPGTNPPV
ncbi:Phosphoserine phosphatase 1 [Fundidesulfovibrio magnetotacticus]|uniref:Phosphoserine phosphatase 1 n=1 Tax=Fundidesulfovibrio magnetotacticus TaxID=2730080 RepID=A0A6V8LMF5_9BACT|nr:histidine phosphatase family protein [Fundidesulfovibrio magnetotacticus]GFK92190.1 Phosphoserine phosphatase 1 [Fundidesulfovibrio magnetotacticus]